MAALETRASTTTIGRALAAYWGVTERGNWEGKNILHVAGADPGAELVERGRRRCSPRGRAGPPGARRQADRVLERARAARPRACALVLGDDAYASHARLVAFVERHLVREGDRLWRTVRDGRGGTPGFAEDYLAVADGLLGPRRARRPAGRCYSPGGWSSTAIRDFWDDEAGTFVDTSDEHDRTVARPRGLVDNATPSANAIGADVLQRLALLTGEEDFERRARSIVRAVAPALDHQPSAFGRMLSAADRMVGEPIDVVVAEGPSGHGRGLREAAIGPFAPDLVLTSVSTGDEHAGLAALRRQGAA